MNTNKAFVEYDAATGYSELDIHNLVAKLVSTDDAIAISNAHLLTASAFHFLHQIVKDNPGIKLILLGDEPDKIFPPLADCVYQKNEEVGAYSEDPLDELVRLDQEWGMYE